MFTIQPSCHSAAVKFITCRHSCILAESRDDGKHKQRRGANVRQINRPVLWEKESKRTGKMGGGGVGGKKKKNA